jgi:hypothetical protein
MRITAPVTFAVELDEDGEVLIMYSENIPNFPALRSFLKGAKLQVLDRLGVPDPEKPNFWVRFEATPSHA